MYTMFIMGPSRTRQRVFYFIVAILLFIFATLDVALLLRHVLDAFVWYHGQGGPTAELDDISYWVSAMKTVAYVAQTSIGDAVLVCLKLWFHSLSLSGNRRFRDATWYTSVTGRLLSLYVFYGWPGLVRGAYTKDPFVLGLT